MILYIGIHCELWKSFSWHTVNINSFPVLTCLELAGCNESQWCYSMFSWRCRMPCAIFLQTCILHLQVNSPTSCDCTGTSTCTGSCLTSKWGQIFVQLARQCDWLMRQLCTYIDYFCIRIAGTALHALNIVGWNTNREAFETIHRITLGLGHLRDGASNAWIPAPRMLNTVRRLRTVITLHSNWRPFWKWNHPTEYSVSTLELTQGNLTKYLDLNFAHHTSVIMYAFSIV